MNTRSWQPALPGPPKMPIVGWHGNVLRFFRDPIGYIDPLLRGGDRLLAFCKDMRGCLFLKQGPGTLIAVAPEHNHAVLSQPHVYHGVALDGPIESLSFSRLVAGIFGMNGEHQRQQRRLLMPAFGRKQIETHHAAIVELTQQMLDRFVLGEQRDLVPDMHALTLRIAARVLFGLGDGVDSPAVGAHIQEVTRLAMSPRWRLPALVPGSTRGRLCRLAAQLEGELHGLIAAAPEKPMSEGPSALQLLLQSRDSGGETLSENELIGHCFALFLAGHETTMSALLWTLLLLSQHPGVAAQLRQELFSVLAGRPPTAAQLAALPVLDRVIKESLRLLPPAPFIVRQVAAPTVLGGQSLPVGTEVLLSPYHTHRLAELFPQPQRFWPERWESIDPAPYAYLPFGAGARMCLGAALATFELKIVLAMLLQRYSLDLVPGARINRQVTIIMAPRPALPMIVGSPNRPGEGPLPAGEAAGLPPARPRGDIRKMVDL